MFNIIKLYIENKSKENLHRKKSAIKSLYDINQIVEDISYQFYNCFYYLHNFFFLFILIVSIKNFKLH